MAQVNVKINDVDKERAVEALKEMGLTLSAAIRMFIAKVGRENASLLKCLKTLSVLMQTWSG